VTESLAAMRRVPIRDNEEPLVDILSGSPALRWAPRHPVFHHKRARLCRERVAKMLAEAQAQLPAGVHIQVVEGWRSPEAQRMMYRATWEEMRRRHPDWSELAMKRLVNRFSAPPDLPRIPPPHTTGGALDLNLVNSAGEALDFSSPFELTDRTAAAMAVRGLSHTARANRRMLAEALGSAGLTSYAPEWWHWSYGDQGWALRTGQPFAIYSGVARPGD